VFLEQDKDTPENAEWVIFEGTIGMCRAFKEGVKFAEGSEEVRRYRIRLKPEEQEWIKQKIKIVYRDNKGKKDES
tara:strand:+ start:316 stop:540 length:225 start_codon:yes stop_codon:yes gene_type:complete